MCDLLIPGLLLGGALLLGSGGMGGCNCGSDYSYYPTACYSSQYSEQYYPTATYRASAYRSRGGYEYQGSYETYEPYMYNNWQGGWYGGSSGCGQGCGSW